MSKEEVYAVMCASDQRRVLLITNEGKQYIGFVDVFESRLDNEDDESDCAGQGSICFYPDDGEPMLLYEDDIKHIDIGASG